jgi:hypothetical protein
MALDDLTRAGISSEDLRKLAGRELQRRGKAAFYLNEPFLFQREVLCKEEWKCNLAPMHEEGLEWINQGKRKKLILWPRKHLKTTIFTQGEALRRAIIDPDIRILISTSKWDNAKRFLGAIKGYLRSPKFVELYGDLLPGSTAKYLKNNEAELTLTSRINLGLREPTFSTTGLDAAQTSQHYDLIIHDDVVQRQNVSSIDQIEKVIQYYKDSLDLLDSGKEMWILGTRWHPLDLYGWIMDSFCDPRCLVNFDHVKGCRCDFDVTLKELEEGGVYVFPNVFDAEEADELLRQKGNAEFAAQYRNNPYDPSACWFKKRDIEASKITAKELDTVRDKLLWYIAIDPAESVEKRSCLTAGVAVGVDRETGIWYVDDARGVRVETPGFIELCFTLYSHYPYPQFGMETNTRKSLSYAVKDQMARRGIFFTIIDLNPMRAWAGGDVKDQRIKRLIPLFEFGRIKIREDLKDLFVALETLPAARSWDIPDALSYILDMVPPGIGARIETALPKRVVHWKGTGL